MKKLVTAAAEQEEIVKHLVTLIVCTNQRSC